MQVNNIRVHQEELLYKRTIKSFKRKFKKKITKSDISKVVKEFMETEMYPKMFSGNFEYNGNVFYVKKTPLSENKRAMSLLEKGLIYKNGRVVKAKLNFDTADFIGKIMYENTKRKDETPIYLLPDKKLKEVVRKGIISGKLVSK